MTKLNLILLAIVVTGGGTYLALRDDPAPAEERDEPDRRAKRSPAQRTEAAPRSGDLERRAIELELQAEALRHASDALGRITGSNGPLSQRSSGSGGCTS